MPYRVEKRGGERPWKVVKAGKVVGSSKTKSDAEASIRARHVGKK